MTRTQKTVFILVAVVALVLGLTVNKVLTSQGQADPTALLDAGIVLLPQSRDLPELSLVDQDGQAFRVDQLEEQWSLLFFGYTFCPDICPATLAELRQLRTLLPAEARANLRVVLVSVDPQRDTPEQLKKYLGYFDAEFIGLTGEPEAIQKLANAVSIPYIPADTSEENYTVNHSGNLVIIGPDGTQRGFIRAPLKNAKLAAQLPALLKPAG
ncbi:SCO family protein [Pseudomonas lalucatii]|uniref:SCO family protein n=1 Tax=Pseudomonas lalucatii TaxID=1424203 RepID=A0ABS5Q3C8_9PSED|nr:SCO family protein [Pseudomonas lalucatii]MBS7662793.1 SCO family protein [Pseudomonas lalucatii]MBS7691163.1 SCO family protein [Pseudomonas lalucatii]MBS7725706.1 SCO family protein [Pseudomonas lalucatii]QVM88687.1 SCO family protein [Pseudomonas lalucatii]